MRNMEEYLDFYRIKNNEENQKQICHKQDPQWQFRKVQSIYEVAKDRFNPLESKEGVFMIHNQQHTQEKRNSNPLRYDTQSHSNDYNFIHLEGYNPKYLQKPIKNFSSKANTETNVVSSNQSLQYLSSQEPSFSQKDEFTVFQDFNLNNVSPVKKIPHKYTQLQAKKDWQSTSFCPSKKSLNQKCVKIYEFIQELKFMKEGLESKLKQQKIFFTNQVQEIKKFLFKLNIKYQKEILEYAKTAVTSGSSRLAGSRIQDTRSGKNLKESDELIQLRQYCQQLEEEKAKSQQRYQITLKNYQSQIQIISQQLQKRIDMEKSANFSGGQYPVECSNCQKYKQLEFQAQSLKSYEIQIWKSRLQQEQEKHSQAMKRLQEKVYSLQQEFEYVEQNKSQMQKQLKQRQRKITYRQSELEYQFKDLQKRERQLQMKSKMLQRQLNEIQRKKQKITDYELKIFKDEKKIKNELKEKQMMTSEYFSNAQKRRILLKNSNVGVERSDSKTSKSSRVDISTRLKEIQMMRNNGTRNYLENGESRNSRNASNDSRFSGMKQLNSPRTTGNRDIKDYRGIPSSGVQKQYGRQNGQMIKLSQKLNTLTQTLQKQLREIK